MQEQSDLKQIFLERTLDSVDAARDWMLLLGRKTAQEKVAALLLTILQRTSRPCADCEHEPGRPLVLPLTRTEMADYLGLRLETVGRQLKQLEAIGIIKRLDPRRISVPISPRSPTPPAPINFLIRPCQQPSCMSKHRSQSRGHS